MANGDRLPWDRHLRFGRTSRARRFGGWLSLGQNGLTTARRSRPAPGQEETVGDRRLWAAPRTLGIMIMSERSYSPITSSPIHKALPQLVFKLRQDLLEPRLPTSFLTGPTQFMITVQELFRPNWQQQQFWWDWRNRSRLILLLEKILKI